MKKGIFAIITLLLPPWLAEVIGQIPIASERVVVTNERRINSDELEYSPVFYKEGIVFVSTRHESVLYEVKDKNANGVNIMSIFQAQRDDEGFLHEPTVLANELLTRVHEGPVTFDRTAETIFFTRNETQTKAPDGFKKLQVYQAKKQGDLWGEIKKLAFNDPDFNYLHPSISADNDVMFIASDIPGGYGGMDLYAVYKGGEEWSQLVNLGSKVNTPGNEVFPFIAADGVLYFSSDGHGGYGNLDIFYTTQVPRDESWREPVNLNSPFNSPSDDFGFIVDRDNKNGYFSSDRKGGFGGDDIYSFFIEGTVGPIAGGTQDLDGLVVKDEDGNPLEGATISAINFDEISLSADDAQIVKLLPGSGGKDNFILDVSSGGLGKAGDTGADGQTDLTMNKGNYVLKITKDGYVPAYVTITPDTDLRNLDVRLRRAVDCIPLAGRVWMEGGKTPVSGAEVHIVDVESQEAVIVYSDATGSYDYCINCNRVYSVYAVKNGVTSAPGIASAKNIPCAQGEKINLPLYLGGTPLFAGMTIELPNIYFNFDDAALRPDAHRDLDEVVGMLMNYPGMKLELASHTDARGTSLYNWDLSERRSASVFRYLTAKGVKENRLTPRGYGESQIRNRCTDGVVCSEKDHQYNRRTEIKILEIGTTKPAVTSPPIASTGGPVTDDLAAAEAEESSEATEEGKGGQEMVTPVTQPEIIPAGVADEKRIEGSFAVIAGTFANYDFAVRRATLLTGLGYQQTSIVKQERNGLYAVWVKTFDDKSGAFSLVKTLAGQQLRAYVLKR
jgi:outer membrane protein OmpA-like peptidoglycan-associated protein